MADFTGSLQDVWYSQADGGSRAVVGGMSTNVTASKTAPPQAIGSFIVPGITHDEGTWEATGEGLVELRAVATFAGDTLEGPSLTWFETVHVLPLEIVLGNIISTVTTDIEIYNASRHSEHTLSVATNNAGEGVSFLNLPGLPHNIAPQYGLVFQVMVVTDGPPNIDGTLDFTLDTGAYSIPITGTRVVMFAFEPEAPIREVLEFLTDVQEAIDGTELRVCLRKYPRQLLEYQLKVEESATRRYLHSLLFGFQPGTFGVPIWFEARALTTSVVAGATTVYLDTSYADFRADGLAMVWTDENTWDALEIASLDGSSITFSSAVLNNHNKDVALVMPLRLALAQDLIEVRRHPKNLDEVVLQFTVTDNEADIGSTAAFDTHNGKPMLDDNNYMESGTIDDSLGRRMVRQDNRTAPPRQSSDWVGSRYRTAKGFVCNSPQAIWQVRQLVHALHGSQVGFYMPTFYTDMVAIQNLVSGSVQMDIANIGYTELVVQREPNSSIRIELTDGTVLTRVVTDSEVIDDTTERLTVDTAWASTITTAQISRISYLRLCRIADDRVYFTHQYAGSATVQMGVLAVQS